MLAEMPAGTWWEWLAYFKIEPFGPLQDDLRAGQVAAVVANTHRNRKKKTLAWEPKDFFPALKGPKRRQTLDEMLRAAEAITLAFRGHDLRKNKGRPQ